MKLLTIGMSVAALTTTSFTLSKIWNVFEEVQAAAAPIAEKFETHEVASAHAPAAAGGHGAAASAGHGGGHGAPASDGHGAPAGGGHGEPAGHGGGHGAPAGGHGEAAAPHAERGLASVNDSPLVSIEEVISNINSIEGNKSHLLGVKLELELFEEGTRAVLDQHQAGIRNTVLMTSVEQSYEKLSTIAGKLYYKELLVSRLNEFFNTAIIRDVHFSSFYLQ